MRNRRVVVLAALSLSFALAGCGRGRDVVGMDANDLSDARGAKAGRFLPPGGDNAVPADATTAPANGSVK